MPGLGIVAAVLGVVITMGSLGGPPEEIGAQVAAALVGTFLGILLCYGVVGPLSSNMSQDRRRSQQLSARAARIDALVSQRLGAHDRNRDGAPRDSRARAAQLRRDGEGLQERHSVASPNQLQLRKRRGSRKGLKEPWPSNKTQPIIVIKKKGGHGGHHGGAWKVAYADFVTAMMALFIVLWLMGSSEKVKKAVAGYFNDPKGTANLLGTTMTGNGVAVTTAANDDMQKLKEKLEEEIKARKELEKLSKQIEITITPEGLRIELMEDKNGTFYQSGSARLSDSGQELLALLAGRVEDPAQ